MKTLVLPDTPLYGTVRAEAWHGVHPQVHGDRGWFAGQDKLPVLRGGLLHVTAGRRPDGRDPHRQMWLWHACPAPCPRASSGVPTSHGSPPTEHAIRTPKGTLGRTAAKVRAPEQADRWARVVIAAHAQLLLARPPPPTCAAPGRSSPARPLSPGRAPPGGSATSAASRRTPARVPKAARPGDEAAPKPPARDPRPVTFSPVKPTCHAPPHPLTRQR